MKIQVTIAGRTYPLTIAEGEEEIIRQTVKSINDKIAEYQLTFTQSDKQDCLAMAALAVAVDAAKNRPPLPVADPKLEARLSRLDSVLSNLV